MKEAHFAHVFGRSVRSWKTIEVSRLVLYVFPYPESKAAKKRQNAKHAIKFIVLDNDYCKISKT